MRQGGFTYLGVIAAVTVIGVALAATGEVWQLSAQRERERELLFAGSEFQRAIQRYYSAGPGPMRRYPRDFDELLRDPRFPNVVRHLRRVYRDPVTGKAEWGIVRAPDGGMLGVYSLSHARPIKRGRFSVAHARFAGAQHYSDWKFLASADAVPYPAATSAR